MKLLSKQDISTLKTNERKMEIDEGVKLAQRVDKLRELSSIEQAKLSKFLDESLANVHLKIDESIVEHNDWLNKIESAKEQREILLQPLTVEWEEVNNAKEQLKQDRTVYEDSLSKLLTINAENITQKEELDLENKRLDYERGSIAQIREEANADKEEAKRMFKTSRESAQQVKVAKEKTIKQLTQRELDVKNREREVELADGYNKRKETELINAEKAINDKYITLMRTQSRIRML